MTTHSIERTCPECGRVYLVPTGISGNYQRKYCSDKCAYAAVSRQQIEMWADWRAEMQRRRERAS